LTFLKPLPAPRDRPQRILCRIMTASALPVVFLHANGYPAGVYRQFLAALAERHPVSAMDIVGVHRAEAPGRGWRNLLTPVLARIDTQPEQQIALVGHSMGGYLAAMAAARRAGQVAQVVLIDAPMVSGWRSTLVSVSHATGLSRRIGPAPVAARRRQHWASRDEARRHLAAKPFVQRWAPGVLDDFIAAALTDDPAGGVSLTIPREAERDIYATLAHRAALHAVRTLRKCGVPTGFVAGSQSEELRLAGREENRAFWGQDWRELDSGHLIPMEQPEACAAAVQSLLGAY
jgi:pimeloyl-ACP methyl ester carboxylesterase